jgi:putative radical SAM enzyme (TIGR03279 family)
MKIIDVKTDSIANELGLNVGDKILKINGQPVRDIIDYRFLIAEEDLEIEVLHDGQTVIYEIEKDFDDNLGLEFEEIQSRFCGNDCPFCFVDQNPEGMRQALYFRDEDFRLSFLSGHYVTLTNLSKKDMQRIVTQRLSPLFVSVHATEPEVRKFLFGIRHDDRLFDKLTYLTQHDIEIHTQIVLCPEVNDGPVLKKTIWDLAQFQPNLKSVSIVPVGLTKHRRGLKKLKPVTEQYAAHLLDIAEEYALQFLRKTGEYFVYAADEFYIMAAREIPSAERYDGFYQKENGVGMVRYLLDDFAEQAKTFPGRLPQARKATFVTAALACGFMNQAILPVLNRVGNFEARLEVVENEFYGTSIKITGLLTGQDIFNHLLKKDCGDIIYLPANCLKDHTLFLDDWTIDRLSSELAKPVVPLDNDFTSVFDEEDQRARS